MGTLKTFEKIVAGILISIVFTLFALLAYNVIYNL